MGCGKAKPEADGWAPGPGQSDVRRATPDKGGACRDGDWEIPPSTGVLAARSCKE